MTYKIFITSVGSLVGQNILDALENRRSRIFIAGTNSLAEAPGNVRCDQTWLVPEANSRQDYKTCLLSLFSSEKPDLVIPGRDDDVVILAELAQDHPEMADIFLVGCREMALVMDDKFASAAFAEQHGLPFAETVASDDIEARGKIYGLLEKYGFPLIAKPRAGNGSKGVLMLTTTSHIENIVGVSDYAIQPMIDPPENRELDLTLGLPFFWGVSETRLYGVQHLIDRAGQIDSGCGFLAKMVMGRCERLQRCDDAGLLRVARRYAESAASCGWRGPINLQFKKNRDGEFIAIELNGRFTGGTSARCLLGFDEVGTVLNTWLGPDAVERRPISGQTSVVIKSLSDFPLDDAALRTLQLEGKWSRYC